MTKLAKQNIKYQVFEVVEKIPRGRVTTYGEIARELRVGPRVVGWMLHLNKSNDVPCHRVVDRNGRLAPNFAFSAKGGPASGWDGAIEHRRRLEVEGVKFVDKMHVDLAKSIWQGKF